MTVVLIAFLVGLVALQIFATVRVWRTDMYVRSEKMNQSKLVWLLPVLGAVIVLTVMSEENHRHGADTHLKG